MTDKRTQEAAEHSNMEKDPKDWVTGDEPMTGAQRSYVKTLSEEAKQPFDEALTKAQASRRIDELQKLTGRGLEARRDGPSAQGGPSSGQTQQEAQDAPESELGEEDPGAALDMMMADEPDEESTSQSPGRETTPEDKPLQSPVQRSPGLENEEPEFNNERDIPTEDKASNEGKRSSSRVEIGPR